MHILVILAIIALVVVVAIFFKPPGPRNNPVRRSGGWLNRR